jgi:hypothetical protein
LNTLSLQEEDGAELVEQIEMEAAALVVCVLPQDYQLVTELPIQLP